MAFDEEFNTILSPQESAQFAAWKRQYAPNDSGADYDLRGAFKAGLRPDQATGHWEDTFKKPNHPTFSDQSQYASYGKPGSWQGETYIPHKEAEDFEFRLRMEQEAAATPPAATEPTSALAVAGNAAAKGLAGAGDFILNIAGAMGNTAIPPPLRPGAMQNPIATGMEAAGMIRPENEPQTPGQRILDMAVQAGVGTAIAPAKSLYNAAINVVKGVVSGITAATTKEATGSDLAAVASGVTTSLVTHGAGASTANKAVLDNPVKAATLKDAQAAGLKVVPSSVKPSVMTNKMESIGGKAAIKQQTQAANVETINELARKSIGLPSGTPITKDSIGQVRTLAAQPMQEVDALRASHTNLPWFPRYHSASLFEEYKQARADANATFAQFNVNKDPATLARAKQFRTEAKSIETDIEMIAKASGNPDLAKRLKAGIQLYARTYDVERATNFADGNVNANVLGAMFRKKIPLSGELAVIGKFASAFPGSVREAARIPAAGVSGTEAGMSALLATAGAAAAGNPAGLLAGGLPLLRAPARAALLSESTFGIPGTTGYQQRLLRNPPELNQAVLQSILAGRAIGEAR